MNGAITGSVSPTPTVASGPSGDDGYRANDDQRVDESDEFAEFGIFTWQLHVLLLAHIKITRSASVSFNSERFLLLYPVPEALERLSQYPSEVISLWLHIAGARQPRQLTVVRVVDVVRWHVAARDSSDLLVLRCENGETYGLDQDGIRLLRASTVYSSQ